MMNVYLKWKDILSLLPVLLAGLIFLNGCEVDHTLDPKKYARIYLSQARKSPVKYTIITGIDSTQIIEYRAVYGGPGKPAHDITVHFSINSSLVDSFNTKHFTSYPLLPKDNYELSNETAIIPAGQTYSEALKLKIKGKKGIPDNQYLLPLTITESTGDIQLNQNLKTAYFLLQTHRITPVNTDVIITGFLVNPSGSDVPQVGDSRSYDDTQVSFTFKGGLEYIQLMALRDIDFSKTPYSVVVGRYNNGPMVNGWATGGQVSFKFDLTQGTAAAGTFFYVGEGQMVIDGYSHDGLSTDISNANWIRNLDPNVDGNSGTVTGDGFGNSTTGLLTNGEANATGLAVFEGTSITSSSVPVDVVFYGGSVGNAYQAPYGYRVPLQSDLYSAEDTESGEMQSLFGQGTNTFSVSGANANQTFVQMGGAFSQKYIFKPRTNPNLLKLGQASSLEDIEGGEATQYITE